MDIDKKTGEISATAKEFMQMYETRKRAKETYEDMKHYIKYTEDYIARQGAQAIMFAVGDILGKTEDEVDEDIRKVKEV